MSSPSGQVLIALLAQRLFRGQRCETCYSYDGPDERYGGGCSYPPYREVEPNDRCTLWEPRPGCGLDPLGIPLASSASEVHQ